MLWCIVDVTQHTECLPSHYVAPLYSNILHIYTQGLLCVRHFLSNTIYLVMQERNFYISLTLPSAPPCTFSGVFSSMNVILMYFSTASLTLYASTHWLIHLISISVHWNNTMLFSGLPNSSFFSSLFPTRVHFLFAMSNTADLCMSLPCLTNLWLHSYCRITCKLHSVAHKDVKNISAHLSGHSSSQPLMNLWPSHSTLVPVSTASHQASMPFPLSCTFELQMSLKKNVLPWFQVRYLLFCETFTDITTIPHSPRKIIHSGCTFLY